MRIEGAKGCLQNSSGAHAQYCDTRLKAQKNMPYLVSIPDTSIATESIFEAIFIYRKFIAFACFSLSKHTCKTRNDKNRVQLGLDLARCWFVIQLMCDQINTAVSQYFSVFPKAHIETGASLNLFWVQLAWL